VSKRSVKSSGRRRSKVGRRSRGGRVRPLLAIGACLLALSIVGALALFVTITHRFDGRLWQLPTRVYSDTLVLNPGRHVSPAELVERLERGGYARTEAAPRFPGQYRARGLSLELFVRGFRSADALVPARQVALEFQDGRRGRRSAGR